MAVQSILNGTDTSIAPRPMAEMLTGCVIGAIRPSPSMTGLSFWRPADSRK